MKHPNLRFVKSITRACASPLEMLLGTALTAVAFRLFILPQNFAAADGAACAEHDEAQPGADFFSVHINLQPFCGKN